MTTFKLKSCYSVSACLDLTRKILYIHYDSDSHVCDAFMTRSVSYSPGQRKNQLDLMNLQRMPIYVHESVRPSRSAWTERSIMHLNAY